MASKVFEKYYSKLAKEGILKSLFVGLIVGFAVAFVVAFVTWFTGHFWISLVAGAVVTAVVTLIVYNKAFKPTTKGMAKRIDMLGLEERLITMEELKNDDSYIAMRQREDALEKLNTVNEGMLRFKISKALIVAASIVVGMGLVMTGVSAAAQFGLIGDGGHAFDQIIKPKPGVTYSVTYSIYNDEGGMLVGNMDQVVEAGADATSIVAMPEEGWVFYMWSDGVTNPVRTDKRITEDVEVEAIFMELSERDGNGEESDEEGDGDPEAPPEQGQESDKPGDSDKDAPPSPSDSSGKGTETNDNIIDGNTDYEDALGNGGYYEEQMKRLAESGELSAEMKEIISRYFESLGRGNGDDEP